MNNPSIKDVADVVYFNTYDKIDIHRQMIDDKVRTKSYRDYIYQNKHIFKDKIVLDVGCGTGILSLFAAKSGAKKVIGIDNSNIIDQTNIIVKDNGYENVITLVKGKAEEIDSLPDGIEKVDIILHELMGHFLLFESSLNTVIHCRDRWLKPGGIIAPDEAVMYLTAVEDEEYEENGTNFWDNVYDFDMSAIKKIPLKNISIHGNYSRDNIVCETVPIKTIDLMSVKVEDLSFSSSFKLDAFRKGFVNGFIGFFSYSFTSGRKPITVSTSPYNYPTHWCSALFYLTDDIIINKDEFIDGTISITPSDDYIRSIDVTINYNFSGKYQQVINENKKFYGNRF